MLKISDNSFIFLPTIENHYKAFLPVMRHLVNNGVNAGAFYVHELIADNRHFLSDDNLLITRVTAQELKDLLKGQFRKTYIIVGNDSEPKVCALLRKAKCCGIRVILFQDGWLEAKNINNPIYPTHNFSTFLKKRLHKALTSKRMPTKRYFHNFIGQNADLFFVYSEVAKQNFIASDIEEHKIFVTGSPRHGTLKKVGQAFLTEDVVVFFSTVAKEPRDFEFIQEGLKWVRSYFPKKKVILKIHPRESRVKYLDFENENLIVEQRDLLDLLKLYTISFSFCFASTVIFDTLILNIPILQLAPFNSNRNASNYFPELGIATDPSQFQRLMKSYDLESVKLLAEKYLMDINTDFDSVTVSAEILKKLL